MDREPLRSTPGVSHIWIGYDPETLEIHDRFEYEGDWYGYQDHLTYEVLPKTLHNKPYKLTNDGFELDEEKWTEMQPRVFERLRQERNKRLTEVDWIFSEDYAIDDVSYQQWLVYRKALRDLPSTTEDPANPIWPEKPVMPSGTTETKDYTRELQIENNRLKNKVAILENRQTHFNTLLVDVIGRIEKLERGA